MTNSFGMELKVALEAVATASRLALLVLREQKASMAAATHTDHLAVMKKDRSPVTVADYGAQAIVNNMIRAQFPEDAIVGEEDSQELRNQPTLQERILKHVQPLTLPSPIDTTESLLNWIDVGGAAGGDKGRCWALDPIDGTKGFLRAEQFAVALGLLVDGQVQLGVLGCPNLCLSANESEIGYLVYAIRGHGSFCRRMNADGKLVGEERRLEVSPIADSSMASFCESVESGHSNQNQAALIAQQLGIHREPKRMDSQCKYAVVGSGLADIYLRLPVSASYQEKIWDHAAGDLIVREAGGQVTDIDGKPLDFSQGRYLSKNRGVVATSGRFHEKVLKAVRNVLNQSQM